MADTYVKRPRRVEVGINLHAGEIAGLILHDDILHAMTEEELKKIAFSVGTELQDRNITTPKEEEK